MTSKTVSSPETSQPRNETLVAVKPRASTSVLTGHTAGIYPVLNMKEGYYNPILTTDAEWELYQEVGRFFVEKYRTQAEKDRQKAASNMRKQGVVLDMTMRVLAGAK